MNEQLWIEKNKAWIIRQVNIFSDTQTAYGSIRYDKDDLFQECVTYLLKRLRRSGIPLEDFRASKLDLRHVMCEYLQSLLPVNVPKTVRNYSFIMEKYSPSIEIDTENHTTDANQAVLSMEDSEFFPTSPG